MTLLTGNLPVMTLGTGNLPVMSSELAICQIANVVLNIKSKISKTVWQIQATVRGLEEDEVNVSFSINTEC